MKSSVKQKDNSATNSSSKNSVREASYHRPQQSLVHNILREPMLQRQQQQVKRKVLVTGFNDWRNLGNPPNLWKCDENPSCRLLVGNATTSQPSSYGGPLVTQLNSNANIDWEYRTLPTTWGAAQAIPYQNYDAVINMGLGVYDTSDAIQIEQNAYNQRSGTDAAGTTRSAAPIDSGNASTTLSPSSSSGVNSRITAMDQQQLSAQYQARVAQARANNDFICNETHYHAITELNSSLSSNPPGRLKLVYFIHLPQPRTPSSFGDLASGTADVIRGLL